MKKKTKKTKKETVTDLKVDISYDYFGDKQHRDDDNNNNKRRTKEQEK